MKSTDWIGNLVSIAMFAMLALASFGLSEYLAQGRTSEALGADSGPNAIIENARVVRTDSNGNPQFRLETKKIIYNERGDQSTLDEPILVSLATDRPQTTVRAKRAVATDRQDRIELSGDVVISRAPFAGQPAARITTSRATLFLEEERAVTDAPVFVQRGSSTLQGVGLRFDQKTQKIDIISESRMVVPRENTP